MSSVAEKLQRKSQRPVATKQVRLKLVYIDFWSTVKLSFLLALSLGVVLVVSTILIYLVLQTTGVFGKIDDLLTEVLSGDAFTIAKNVPMSTVAFFAVMVAIVNTVIGTALGAIASMLYNLSVRVTGGLLVGFTNN